VPVVPAPEPALPCCVPVPPLPPDPDPGGTLRRGLLVQAPMPAMTKQDMTISALFMETFS
jgi:hypothetical protein